MSDKPKRPRLQFSLRTLLVGITLLCIGPGGYVVYEQSKARKEKGVIESIQRLGGVPHTFYDGPTQPRSPAIRWLLGDDSFGNTQGLLLNYTPVTEADLASLASLPRLTHLSLDNTRLDDGGLVHVGKLKRLGWLSLANTRVTDVGLAQVAGLTELRYLSLQGTQVTDAGVAELQKALPNCRVER